MNSLDKLAPTVPLIEDVVTATSSAEFRNDVQLAQYRSAQNLQLARDFIFTRKAAGDRRSSIELLKYLCEAFMPGAPPNRFVFIATYGHGKSHFAVATANYFGKPTGSCELEGVLRRIKHAAQDSALYGFFEAFKTNHQPFLILILRGDEPSDLHTKFFRGVEEALSVDQGASRKVPFWHIDAAKFVEGIIGEATSRREQANTLLAQHQLDLNILLERIKSQDATTFEIARELFIALNHVAPDFGTGLSLKDAVQWLGKNLVGADKPYAGILILFDEFSSFIWDYALRIRHRPGAPLQDLLNGVESMRGKVAFAALAQRDPELIAKSLLAGSDSLQSLITQLNRLPKPQHYQLHSSLEEVLNAYLKQNSVSWNLLHSDANCCAALGQANDLSFDIFSQRYQDVLEWDIERFQEVVTQGCFPLHPATTALLSSVELETTNNPRSVLGFVVKHLDLVRGLPAHRAGHPTWILPTTLVDYFRDMLGQKAWTDFGDALAQAGGPDASPDEIAVLKAMLLQVAGKVQTRGAYPRVVAQFAGLSLDQATRTLQALTTAGVIRFESSNKVYTFWPAGKGANKVDKILSEKLRGKVLDGPILDALLKPLREVGLLKHVSVPVPWGHQDDWQAEQLLASRHNFTVEALRQVAVTRLHWHPDGVERCRGLVVWVVAESPEDAAWIRDNASDVLAKAFPTQSAPVLIMKPNAAQPELVDNLLRLYALSLFTNGEIAELGQQQVDAVKQFTCESIKAGFKALKDDVDLEVPSPFTARINAIRLSEVDAILGEIFKMAYCDGPKRWFTQYKLSSTKLRNSVARVTLYALTNALDTPEIFAGDNVSKEILQQMRSEWALLGADQRIKAPLMNSKIRPAWDLLQDSFPASGVAARAQEAVSRLLNVPFGYDYNTLSLVFASWFGFNRHDLEVSQSNRLTSLKTIAKDLKPKEFVEAIASIVIKRTDASQVLTLVRQCLDRLDHGSFTKAEAEGAIHLFRDALERDDVDQKPTVEAARNKLQEALDAAVAYDKAAADLERIIDTQHILYELAKVLVKLAKIQMPTRVKPERLSPSELRELLLARIRALTEKLCDQFQQLKTIADFGLHQQHLKTLRKTHEELQLPDLVSRVDSAIVNLAAAKVQLESRLHDAASIEILKSLEVKGPLLQLIGQIRTIENTYYATDAGRLLSEEKASAMRAEVERLRAFNATLAPRVAAALDGQSIESVQADILRHQNLFDGSDEADELQESLKHCKQLRTFFETLEAQRRFAVRTPADIAERVEALRSIAAQYKPVLSLDQEQTVSTTLLEIQGKANEQTSAAIIWLEGCEKTLGDPRRLDELSARLKAPPAFLPAEREPARIALLGAVNAKLHQRLEEEQTIARIRATPVKGALVDLKTIISELSAFVLTRPDAQDLLKTKLVAIHGEVRQLERFCSEVKNGIAAARDVRGIERIQTDILRQVNLFENSTEGEDLQTCLTVCGELRVLFEAIEAYGRGAIRSPADAGERIEGLTSLLARYATITSVDQARVVSDAIASIEDKVEGYAQAAIKWLDRCEQVLAKSDKLDELALTLKSPPAFFPKEQTSRLNGLVTDLAARELIKQQEEASVKALAAITVKGGIQQLSAQLLQVEALAVGTGLARKMGERKLTEIQTALEKLLALKVELARRVGATLDTRSLDVVYSELLRQAHLFDDSEHAVWVQEALDRCRQLKDAFSAVVEYRRTTLNSPTEVRSRIQQLSALLQKYESVLSVCQKGLISDVRADAEAYADHQTELAVTWMDQCQRLLEKGDTLEELAVSLDSPPQFLPDERRTRLAVMVKEVSQRIDDDQVLKVIAQFMRIADLSRRVECLDKLKVLIAVRASA